MQGGSNLVHSTRTLKSWFSTDQSFAKLQVSTSGTASLTVCAQVEELYGKFTVSSPDFRRLVVLPFPDSGCRERGLRLWPSRSGQLLHEDGREDKEANIRRSIGLGGLEAPVRECDPSGIFLCDNSCTNGCFRMKGLSSMDGQKHRCI